MKTKEKVDYWALIPDEFKASVIAKEIVNYRKNPTPKTSVDVFDFFEIKDKAKLSDVIEELKDIQENHGHKYDDLIILNYQYYDSSELSIQGVNYLSDEEIIANVIRDARHHYNSYKRSISKEIKEREEYERLKKKFENK